MLIETACRKMRHLRSELWRYPSVRHLESLLIMSGLTVPGGYAGYRLNCFFDQFSGLQLEALFGDLNDIDGE